MVNEVFSDTESNINSFVKAVRLLTVLLVTLLFIPVSGEAQSRITPCNLAVKTNLAYDALGAPSLGMEIEVGRDGLSLPPLLISGAAHGLGKTRCI